MTWAWALALPLAVQTIAMLVDEGYFHRKRGLGRWERVGHPLDTLTVLVCLAWVLFAPPSGRAIAVYAGLAMSGREHSRSLVLAFSDGLDNASWLSDEVVRRAAERSDAVVYGVAVAETPALPGRPAPRDQRIEPRASAGVGGLAGRTQK